MNVKQSFLCIVALGSIMPHAVHATNSAASSSVGNEQSQVILVANVDVGAGASFNVSGGAQTGTTGNVSAQASADQKFTADIPVGPGGGMGGLGGALTPEAEFGGAFLGGLAGQELNDEGGAGYPQRGRLRSATMGGEGEPYSGMLADIDVSAKVTQGSVQQFDASGVTFEKVEFNNLMQLRLPDYSPKEIKKIASSKKATLVKGYEIRPTAGAAFELYQSKKQQLVIKLLITIQQARQVTLDALKEAGKEVKPVNGKPILEIVVYRETPGEAKKSQWTELMSIVQNVYDPRPGALFKIDEKAWLSVYISKAGVPTTLIDSGVTEKLPFALPADFTFTPLKDNEWKNSVKTQNIRGFTVAGYSFGKENILFVSKDERLVIFRKLASDWKRVGIRDLDTQLSRPGYYVQIQNAANNGFLDLYDTSNPAFVFKLAMRDLFGKKLKPIE